MTDHEAIAIVCSRVESGPGANSPSVVQAIEIVRSLVVMPADVFEYIMGRAAAQDRSSAAG